MSETPEDQWFPGAGSPFKPACADNGLEKANKIKQ